MAWSTLTLTRTLLPTTLLLGACDPEGKHSGHEGDDEMEVVEPSAPAEKPEAAVTCEPDAWEGQACTTADGQEGTSFCIVEDGVEHDTPCSTEPSECVPGESWDYGCMGEICYWDGEAFRRYSWSEPDCETPLVVSFDGAPIEFTPAVAAAFDLSPNGTCQSSDWPTAPWLALDRDGDGSIRDGSELFGSATKMSRAASPSTGSRRSPSSTAIATARSPPPTRASASSCCGATSTTTASAMAASCARSARPRSSPSISRSPAGRTATATATAGTSAPRSSTARPPAGSRWARWSTCTSRVGSARGRALSRRGAAARG